MMPEMVLSGARLILERTDDLGPCRAQFLAADVFRAMDELSHQVAVEKDNIS
jgi:hypothetical protein